jgi:hypothetical protein
MTVNEATGDAVPGWSRMPNESARALGAAREYFKIGASRSIASVSRTLGKHVSLRSGGQHGGFGLSGQLHTTITLPDRNRSRSRNRRVRGAPNSAAAMRNIPRGCIGRARSSTAESTKYWTSL